MNLNFVSKASVLFLSLSKVAAAQNAPMTVATNAEKNQFEIGVRADCAHDFNRGKGETQDCVSLTGARLGIIHHASDRVSAQVGLDPYSTPKNSYVNAPRIYGRPDALNGDFISDYKLLWLPRPHLEVSLESFRGSTVLPSVSGLALANLHNDTGWRQTAATITYNLSVLSNLQVKFAVGNGEGEYRANVDPQQYFGFRTTAELIKGLSLVLGVSVDGNDVGSDEYDYDRTEFQSDCGIDSNLYRVSRGASTQRIAAGIEMDGTLERAKNLMIGLGYQRSVMSDLDKEAQSRPGKTELAGCRLIDPTTVFVEDETGDQVNTVQRTLVNLNARYSFAQSYFAAVDYSLLTIDSGNVKLFDTCNTYEGGRCTATSGDSFSDMTINTYTFGAGLELSPGLELIFEMYKSSYDKKYALAFYDAPDGKTSDTQEFFNARISYNWK